MWCIAGRGGAEQWYSASRGRAEQWYSAGRCRMGQWHAAGRGVELRSLHSSGTSQVGGWG